jgi:ribonuclease T2
MERKKIGLFLVTVWLLFNLDTPSVAGVSVTGEFTATKNCQAYQSIKRKTNPGGVQLEIGQSYPVIELNVSPGTTWYRLRIDNTTPAERWAYFDCGTAEISFVEGPSFNTSGNSADNTCHTAGLEDSYVFAISWQPAFCEEHQDKPECSVSDPQSYQAGNFTLHGLWPNKKSCGTGYGLCGKYKAEKRPFCDYDPVPLQAETLEKLGKVMPSAAHGSCLQLHEWYKHGTCQTEWDADGYFAIAMRLLEEFNTSGIATFMTQNIGKSVTTSSFFEKVDDALGKDASRRLQISCSRGMLVDVYIHLPANLPEDATLAKLINQAEPAFNNKCGTSFQVDAIGQ